MALANILQRIHKSHIRAKVWWEYGRKYQTTIKPFDLVLINPNSVRLFQPKETRSQFEQPDYIPEVVGGDWDKKAAPIENHGLYESLWARYENNALWENTRLYKRVVNSLSNGKQKFGCKTKKEFEDRLDKIDRLYDEISSSNYKTQEELKNGKKTLHRHIPNKRPPETHEVAINIGRQGEMILYEGHHRMILAQISDIEQIPIRIKTRHSKWMEYRDKVTEYNGNQTHPDLQNLE